MRRNRRVKIVATLGPASTNEETMRRLFEAGADVFRVNMSHANHDGLREIHGIVRKLESEFARPIGIVVDLQGPKLRIGKIDSGSIRLTKGDILSFVRREDVGGLGRIHLPHPEVFAAVEKGHTLLLDDGKLKLRVVDASDVRIDAEALDSGLLGSRKGISLPDTVLPFGALTDKDRADIEYAMSLGVSWMALSFVQRPEDIAEARKLSHGRTSIMAKIEKPIAIKHLKEIVDLADGIMVARGDLGVEMPVEKVPGLQKQISRAARNAGKPVVVATQMLESMIHAPTPTRAEASDVATAVYEGADAVMLSAETAAGAYPIETVTMMDRIVRGVERDPAYLRIMDAEHPDPEATASDAITAAARQVAHTLSAAAIVTYTTSGSTTLRAARERPEVPIIGLTPSIATARRLALVWGVHCVLTGDPGNTAVMVEQARRHVLEEGFGERGAPIVITAGVPFGTPGTTNMLRIARV
jgi:pyruvate kinase